MAGANPLDGLSDFLRGIGLSDATTDATLDAEAERLCAERGIEAKVASCRYGVLVLETQPQQAVLLKYELDSLLSEMISLGFEEVKEVKVKVSRS